MNPRNPYDVIRFYGAKKTYEVLDAAAIVDKGEYEAGSLERRNIVDITASAHGFLAGPNEKNFTCAYVLGTTNYDGMRRIHSVPDVNSIFLYAPYTAETPGGTETLRVAYKSPYPFLWLGFSLHLSAASATSENLVIARDSDLGSAWDDKLYSKDMNGVQDIVYMVPKDEPVVCDENDLIDLTWDNSNSRTWAIKFYVQSRS